MKKISAALRARLKPLQCAESATWQTNYLRGQFPFLGVKTPILKEVVKSLADSTDWRSEVKELWREPEREFHHAAIIWATIHRKKATPEDIVLYEQLILENSWWDTVDTIAPHLAGALFHRFPELLGRTEKWLLSDQLWLKRSALIFQLYKRKEMDSERLFRYCETLSKESDFFIRKAIGWMLREHSKTSPARVREFIKSAELSPLSVREGSKYL